MTQKWPVSYTPRAFQMDSIGAMKAQVHRALIELITNADDAYADKSGPINVFINLGKDEFAHTISVQDRAKGLDFESMKTAFTTIAGVTSGLAEGKMSRGLLGRGAKDVAIFGKVKFEAILNDHYSDVTLNSKMIAESDLADSPATEEQFESLGLARGENGLTATIFVAKNIDLPKPSELREKLSNNAQLRLLIERREVFLYDYRQPNLDGLLVCHLPKGQVLHSSEFEVEGFPGKASIEIRKLPERQNQGVSEFSAHGALITSATSVFQNTWYSLETSPSSKFLAAVVEAPQIMDILRAELETVSEGNDAIQVSLISRTRDGLNDEHEFAKKLRDAIIRVALPYFDQISKEQSSGQKQGEKLKADFDAAAEAISDEFSALLRDLDEEMPLDDPSDGIGDFDAIPLVLVAKPGSQGVITLRATTELSKYPLTVNVLNGSGDLKFDLIQESVPFTPIWSPHQRLDRVVTQVRFTSPLTQGVYNIQFVLGEDSTTVQILVRPESSVNPEIEPPSGLEFFPSRVTSSPGRGKNLKLRAPLDFAHQEVDITCQGLRVQKNSTKVRLRPDSTGRWTEALVHVQTSSETGELTVEAKTGESVAVAKVLVKEAATAGKRLPLFDFELSGDRDGGARFSVINLDGAFKIIVYGRHESFAGVFGDYSDAAKGFIKENTPEARAVLAQLIAQAFAQTLIEIEFDKRPEQSWDPPFTLSRVQIYSEKFAGKLHKALVVSETT